MIFGLRNIYLFLRLIPSKLLDSLPSLLLKIHNFHFPHGLEIGIIFADRNIKSYVFLGLQNPHRLIFVNSEKDSSRLLLLLYYLFNLFFLLFLIRILYFFMLLLSFEVMFG